jgi:GAF domain-containing protein
VDEAGSALADLHLTLAVEEPLEAALSRLTDVVMALIPDATGVSLTLDESAPAESGLSTPLVLGDSVIGTLHVYGDTAFDRLDQALLELITSAASAVITNARRYVRARELADQLQQAVHSRAEIDQAKGVLMAVHGITAKEAFGRLVARSQHTNTKLHDIARQLLASITP